MAHKLLFLLTVRELSTCVPIQNGITKDRMRGSCPKKNGKDHISLMEWGTLCSLSIASVSEKYKVSHDFPHTPLALLMTSFTLRLTNPATQPTWRACVGQLPPKSQTDFVSGKRTLLHMWASPGCLEVGEGGDWRRGKEPSFFKQPNTGSKWLSVTALRVPGLGKVLLSLPSLPTHL